MSDDARFEDGFGGPLNVGAVDPDDIKVISALVQDAVFPVTEIRWLRSDRKFALLLNRFRWELGGGAPERVQSLLVVSDVLNVESQGVDRSQRETVLSLLSIGFEPVADGGGHIVFLLAGDGALRVEVEAVDLRLKDVTRPYVAPSGRAPSHEV
ncbi:Protein of unknown function [Poseidonocella pacifica]|uniref:DUF2948 domain-containing protein n=1 Tax=Poseidonocella pacifica TaxID=871651 RepID=A0A1I0X7N3_9RHOB|nr:DUF2948 family protein [Poseidonocella pacifica]SFA96416.1 Protein of unknown function [Poseidonocella pacifica]